ncbi:MAG: Methionine-tRNA ligase [candidate division WWE3 bacterium GW2011_GWC1_41_7]|uniref:Methionine--tRNA ligase n=4 Tax=Katanobacteria TaxID=422282 RepID=A0A0G0Z9G7_UNCKA|nr:MAG: Methionine-tRNA ligase [candidate division WWE3 bacterium GW2011_GWB1_41_6]KKS18701.1 MAG: Methionine-tRNA ligase [candidate division WWE3 bacterium GW2011_GWC1_41_7]KKS20660.1 MAG: Methionine-tRNA ligase [candidate division WWE3 bacterium GW2011_GWA1_41_8]
MGDRIVQPIVALLASFISVNISFMENVKPEIEIDDLYKIDVRIGTIKHAEAVPNSKKLIKLDVDYGDAETRQILTGMLEYYDPAELTGMQTTFIVNLKPRKMMGLESHGMIFAADGEKPVFLKPGGQVENGSNVI